MSVVRWILLVDDEADPRDTLAEQLKLHDSFETETAGDGAGGIEAAKAGPFDAILLDVGLLDMGGREVCRALRRSGVAEPPIIALRGVSLGYGANSLFEDMELQLLPGERATLVGRNGCGKTTIMKLMAGVIEPDAGELFLQPPTRVSYLPQASAKGNFAE